MSDLLFAPLTSIAFLEDAPVASRALTNGKQSMEKLLVVAPDGWPGFRAARTSAIDPSQDCPPGKVREFTLWARSPAVTPDDSATTAAARVARRPPT